jgi:hypothetical protein
MNEGLVTMWNEVVVTYIKTAEDLPGGTEKG